MLWQITTEGKTKAKLALTPGKKYGIHSMDTGCKSKMAETDPFDLPSELLVLGNSGCSRPRLRAAKANWKTVTFLQQHSKQQEFKHHCHGIATLQEHLKILIKYFLWADVIQPMCLLIST